MSERNANIVVTIDDSQATAALSREALAAGDAAKALDLLGKATGITGDLTGKAAKNAADAAVAEARLAVAYGDRRGAIEKLEAALLTISEEDKNRIRLETQLAQAEGQNIAAMERETKAAQAQTDALVRLGQARARAAAAGGDTSGARTELTGALATPGASEGVLLSAKAQLIALDKAEAVAAEQASVATQRQADADIRLAQEQARAAVASKNYAQALEILNAAKSQGTGASAQTLAALDTQIATIEAQGTAVGALGAEFAALVNPATLAFAAIGAGTAVLKSFGEALDFTAKLDEEQRAFGGILGNIGQGNAILAEATARGKAYGFTQKEVTDAFRELAPIIRTSTASTQDQTEALARISVLQPDKPVAALKSAIEGIQTGRFRELAKELGLSTNEQNQLKNSVAQGKDAFVALNDVLDKHGITLDVARQRMDGYEGASRRAQQAQEDLAKAQGDFAAGPGVAITEARIAATKALTDVFNQSQQGSLGFAAALGYEASQLLFGKQATDQHTQSIQLNSQAQANAIPIAQQVANAEQAYANELELSSVQARAAQVAAEQKANADQVAAVDAQTHAIAQNKLAEQAQNAAKALLFAGPAGATAAAQLAQSSQQVDVLTAAYYRLFSAQHLSAPQTDLQKGLSALRSGSIITGDEISDANVRHMQKQTDERQKAEQKAASQTKQLQDALDQQRLAKATTTAAKIAELERQKAATSDPVEKVRLETQIINERNSAAKAHTGELNKQLNTQEKIRDSLEAQYKAQLDAAELTIKDRQERRKEDQEIRAAQRILASGRSSQLFKDAAADKLALIDIERQKRALEIQDKSATAGGTIINGKVYQSVPSGGRVQPIPLPGPGASGATGTPVSAGGGGAGGVEVLVYLDSEPIAAKVITRMRTGLRQHNAGGGTNG